MKSLQWLNVRVCAPFLSVWSCEGDRRGEGEIKFAFSIWFWSARLLTHKCTPPHVNQEEMGLSTFWSSHLMCELSVSMACSDGNILKHWSSNTISRNKTAVVLEWTWVLNQFLLFEKLPLSVCMCVRLCRNRTEMDLPVLTCYFELVRSNLGWHPAADFGVLPVFWQGCIGAFVLYFLPPSPVCTVFWYSFTLTCLFFMAYCRINSAWHDVLNEWIKL